MNPRRLYRCRYDRHLAGVAAGMAEYLEVDPTLVRVLWVLSAFLGGFSILLYIILAFVMPLEPVSEPGPGGWQAGWPAGPGQPQATGIDPAATATDGVPANGAEGTSFGPAGPDAGRLPGERPAHHAWPAPVHESHPEGRHAGRAGLYLGVILVVFGAIALANAVFPGLVAGVALGPAFLVACGVALLVGATRRSAVER